MKNLSEVIHVAEVETIGGSKASVAWNNSDVNVSQFFYGTIPIL